MTSAGKGKGGFRMLTLLLILPVKFHILLTEGEGSKMIKILLTSYVNGPYATKAKTLKI